MERPTATVDINVWVDCPKCGNSIDLTEDDDGHFLGPLFNNEWQELKGFDVCCDECGHEFKIKEVEY